MPFDKYALYREAVQDPENAAEFLENVYRDLNKRSPRVLREDFCGTFSVAAEWVKRGRRHEAVAVDREAEPLAYGKAHHLAGLTKDEQKRLKVLRADVLKKTLPKADIACALNFSYWIFKDRKTLGDYFKRCFRSLTPKGVLLLDCLGVAEVRRPHTLDAQFPGFTYFWEQAAFNPMTREILFYIHFQLDGKRRREKVFTYDWRLWTVPELAELLTEIGFRNVAIYSQGPGDEAEANWVAYLAAHK